MRLTQWTDYALRVLMYCAECHGRAQPVTISEVAQSHHISRSHLTKIVQQLAACGWLETTRGRGGGMRLMHSAEQINLGAVVRATETDFDMVECFNPELSTCRLSSRCRLKGVLGRATQSYLAVLDGLTLADLALEASSTGEGRDVMPGYRSVVLHKTPGTAAPASPAAPEGRCGELHL